MKSATAGPALCAALALAAGTGCIPIFTPIVEINPTTGEQLQAIHAARAEVSAGGKPIDPAALDAVRARLLSQPPDCTAVIDTYSQTEQPIEDYSLFNPGLYAPLNRERSDLQYAHAAGLLSDEELAELLAVLEEQGKRSVVRRWFETCAKATAWSVQVQYFSSHTYSAYEPMNAGAPDRREAADNWLQFSLFGKEAPRGWGVARGRTHHACIVMTPKPPG